MAESHENKIWCRDLSGRWGWSRIEFVLPGFHVLSRDRNPVRILRLTEIKRKHVCFSLFYDGDFFGKYNSEHKLPVRNMAGNEFIVRAGSIIKRRAPFFRSVISEAVGNGEGVIRSEEVKSTACIGLYLDGDEKYYVSGPGVLVCAENV